MRNTLIGNSPMQVNKLFSKKKTKWDSSSHLNDRHSDYKAPSKEGAETSVKLMSAFNRGKL